MGLVGVLGGRLLVLPLDQQFPQLFDIIAKTLGEEGERGGGAMIEGIGLEWIVVVVPLLSCHFCYTRYHCCSHDTRASDVVVATPSPLAKTC